MCTDDIIGAPGLHVTMARILWLFQDVEATENRDHLCHSDCDKGACVNNTNRKSEI